MKRCGALMWLFSPRPTLFDLCAVFGVVGIPFIPECLHGFYFCFYAVFITVIGFYSMCYRNVSFSSLTLLSLIALSGLFIHAFVWGPNSITFQYLNFYLLFEGFAYVLFGSVMFYTLVTKGRNLKLILITLPIALIPFIKFSLHHGRGSIVFAIAIAVVLFCVKHRKYGWALAITIFALDFFIWKFAWFKMKFACRIPLWHDMIFSTDMTNPGIKLHPFVGSGLNHFL